MRAVQALYNLRSTSARLSVVRRGRKLLWSAGGQLHQQLCCACPSGHKPNLCRHIRCVPPLRVCSCLELAGSCMHRISLREPDLSPAIGGTSCSMILSRTTRMQPCCSGRRTHLCTCSGQPPTLLLVRIHPVGRVCTRSLAVVGSGSDGLGESTCALCRGSNVDGQLGSNATNLATVPIPVANSSYSSPYSFASLSTGALNGAHVQLLAAVQCAAAAPACWL